MEESAGPLDSVASEFATYEDFLDSQIAPIDLHYLEVSSLLRAHGRLRPSKGTAPVHPLLAASLPPPLRKPAFLRRRLCENQPSSSPPSIGSKAPPARTRSSPGSWWSWATGGAAR